MKTPWQYQPLPPDHLHPLTFLRPDVVLHVLHLWKSGKHQENTDRSFALRDHTNFRPFYMMGVSACLEYVKNWRIIPEDVQRLKGIDSLAQLPEMFWDYLTGLTHFTGSLRALPEGTFMGKGSIKVSPDVRESYGDEKVEVPLVQINGTAAEVSLVSEAIAAIIDYSIEISAEQVAHNSEGLHGMYFENERELHPFWAKLATTIESLIANDNPLKKRLNKIWLWSDEILDSKMPARVHQMRNNLETQGYEIGVLSRKEIIR